MQNYTDNANGNVPFNLRIENLWYFQFLWVQGAHMFFGKKNKTDQTFYSMTIM